MEKTCEREFLGEKENSLFVNNCGSSKTGPTSDYGPAVRPYYMIHFVLSGRGMFSTGGQEYLLQGGQGFLTVPEELSCYRADSEEPWTYVWVSFSGSLAGGLIADMGLSSGNPVFRSKYAEEIYKVVKDMMAYNTCEIRDELRRNGQLRIFLSIVADSMEFSGRDTNRYMRKAIDFIQGNYCNPIKITEVAEYVCINRSYLYTLFMNSIGISPQQYLASCRIGKAMELLRNTNFPIEGVALSCGYADSLVFTKAFKQAKGKSPSMYRKEMRRGEAEHDSELFQISVR
jgi:AraC family transcriptional regulator of arabinose operon